MIRKAVIAVSLVLGVAAAGLLWAGDLGSDIEHVVWSATMLAVIVSIGTLVSRFFKDPSERGLGGSHRSTRTRRVLMRCSLLVCLLLIATWLVNLRWSFAYGWDRLQLFCDLGVVEVRVYSPLQEHPRWRYFGRSVGEMHWGFDYYWTGRSKSVGVPLWFPLSLFAICPAGMFISLVRRWNRRRWGYCVQCRYDLTGNLSGICPECGTEVEKP